MKRKNLCLELSRNIRLKIKKSPEKIKKYQKELRDKFMVGVALGLHRLFFYITDVLFVDYTCRIYSLCNLIDVICCIRK